MYFLSDKFIHFIVGLGIGSGYWWLLERYDIKSNIGAWVAVPDDLGYTRFIFSKSGWLKN